MNRRALLAYALAVLVLVLDQASKHWILDVFDLPARVSVEVAGPLYLTMVWNEGVSFGLLRVLGTAFVGMLGTSATEFATRQIASSSVDKLLALVLIGYGVHLFWTHRQRTASEHGWLPPAAGSSRGSMACSAGE